MEKLIAFLEIFVLICTVGVMVSFWRRFMRSRVNYFFDEGWYFFMGATAWFEIAVRRAWALFGE